MGANDSGSQAFPGATGITRRTALGSLTSMAALSTLGRVHAQATPMPGAEDGEAPNHFVLDGAETRITHDVAADAAGARLTYDGPYGSQTFGGDTIRTEESALGRLVTVNLGAFPDQGELSLTLLLPRFNLTTNDAEPAPFSTVAILKWVVSTIAGPPRTGALEEYRVVTLQGTAQVVMA